MRQETAQRYNRLRELVRRQSEKNHDDELTKEMIELGLTILEDFHQALIAMGGK